MGADIVRKHLFYPFFRPRQLRQQHKEKPLYITIAKIKDCRGRTHYIYIYILDREREREREKNRQTLLLNYSGKSIVPLTLFQFWSNHVKDARDPIYLCWHKELFKKFITKLHHTKALEFWVCRTSVPAKKIWFSNNLGWFRLTIRRQAKIIEVALIGCWHRSLKFLFSSKLTNKR